MGTCDMHMHIYMYLSARLYVRCGGMRGGGIGRGSVETDPLGGIGASVVIVSSLGGREGGREGGRGEERREREGGEEGGRREGGRWRDEGENRQGREGEKGEEKSVCMRVSGSHCTSTLLWSLSSLESSSDKNFLGG